MNDIERNRRRHERQQRVHNNRYTAAAVGGVAAVLFGLGIRHELSRGDNSPQTTAILQGYQAPGKGAQVLRGSIVLHTNVNLHSYPSQAMSGETDTSTNIVAQVTAGNNEPVTTPFVHFSEDGLGNTSVWYGFKDNKLNGQTVWVDGSGIETENNGSGQPFITAEVEGDPSFALSDPTARDLETAKWNSAKQEFMVGSEVVAVGNLVQEGQQYQS